MTTARELAERMAEVPPLELAAVRLLLDLEAGADVAQRQAEIERALLDLYAHIEAVEKFRERLEALDPVPGKRVPEGF
jgi:hypothetical protein